MRLILPLLLCLFALPALAEKRAFILANAAYENLSDLANTHADADAYSGAFQELGFAITDHRDLTHFETIDAFDAFLNIVQPGDQVAFVFSGHGWSDGQTNFLVPTDSPARGSERLLSRKSLALRNGYNGVLDELEAMGVSLTVAVIDACRDNPFEAPDGTRSMGMSRGLARISAPAGTFVVFSAGVGQRALDRLPDDPPDQRLSVFSRVFVPHLTSGVTLEDAISASQAETAELASQYNGHRQHPAYYDQTLGETCLRGDCRPQLTVAAAGPGPDACDRLYEEAKSERMCWAYEAYAKSCPTHVFFSFAQGYIGRNCAAPEPADEVASAPPADATPAADNNIRAAAAPDPEESPLVEACDLAAIGPWHPDRTAGLVEAPGIELNAINAAQGIAACRRAVAKFPDHARSLANLGRALAANEEFTEALPISRRAADLGDSQAMNVVAYMYYGGRGVPQDNAETLKWYLMSAESGNPRAQHILGWMYENGNTVSKDLAKALIWYRAAADQGYPDSETNLGAMYLYGRGVAQSDTEAEKWHRRAAERGDVKAQTSLGWMYENGRGVPQDDAQAVKWYRRAAEQGYAWAMANLAWMHENGRGTPQDYAEAVKWNRAAADQGYARGQTNLGLLYEFGKGVVQSDTEAVKWYRAAAEQGYSTAQTNLGWMYDNGRGVKQDYAQAVKWYRAAADQGFARAQAALGYMYEEGRGVPKDDAEAVKWYRAAADQGFTQAQNNMAFRYEYARGLQYDPQRAAKYYFDALSGGENWAIERPVGDWDRETARALQRMLKDAGVYSGAIDGSIGPGSQQAMRAIIARGG